MLFFFSYARSDDKRSGGELLRFSRNLEDTLNELSGNSFESIGFRDTDNLQIGTLSDQKIAKALQDSKVFVAMLSPTYFGREICGKEWTMFENRVNRLNEEEPLFSDEPPIIPILWVPLDHSEHQPPERLKSMQLSLGDSEFVRCYRKKGLKVAKSTTFKDGYNYENFLVDIAQRILTLAKRTPELPRLSEETSLKSVANAFESTTSLTNVASDRYSPHSPLSGRDTLLNKTDFENTLKKTPLLKAILDEVKEGTITIASFQLIGNSKADQSFFVTFLNRILELSPKRNLGIALQLVVHAVLKTGIGQRVATDFFSGSRFTAALQESLAQYLVQLTGIERRESILWAHEVHVNFLKNDCYYHFFLNKHVEVLLADHQEEVLCYLLYPSRGPDNYNIDSFWTYVKAAEKSEPLIKRWLEWIQNGCFDGQKDPGDEMPDLLYKILNEDFRRDKRLLDLVADASHERARSIIRSKASRPRGVQHLVAMLQVKYCRPEVALDLILPAIRPGEDGKLKRELTLGFRAMLGLEKEPNDREAIVKWERALDYGKGWLAFYNLGVS